MESIKEWACAAAIRAIKTFAQTAVALIGTGAVGFTDLDWVRIASVSGVAAVLSILTSVAGLPEVDAKIDVTDVAEAHSDDLSGE